MEFCACLIGASDWLWASQDYRDSKAHNITNQSMFYTAHYPFLENEQKIWDSYGVLKFSLDIWS